MRRLIIEADDFGISPGVNEGIRKALNSGLVKSTNVLINFPYATEALDLQASYPDISIGVHINLTCGYPISKISEVKSLVEPSTGKFYEYKDFNRRLIYGKIRLGELKREMEAQINKAFELGLRITHINSHHGIHSNPIIFALLLKVGAKRGINKLRATTRYYPYLSRGKRGNFLKRFLGRLEKIYSKLYNYKMVDYYLVLKNKNILNNWLYLSGIPAGTSETSCHPGYVDDILKNFSEYTYEREEELDILVSENLKEFFIRNSITLISYKEI